MNVTVQNLAPCKKLVRFEVEATDVDKAFDDVLGQFSKKASLPGFRPGKAPKDMVLKQFSKDIEEEVKRKLMGESYRKGVKDEKLDVLGYPDIEEIQFGKGKDFQFNATIETSPDYELPDYRGLDATRETRTVTDEDVEKALDSLRNPKAEFQTVDRPVQEGDIAVVNYEATCEGKPLTDLAPTAQGLTKKDGFWVEIRTDSFIPGFTEQLVGAKTGDKKTVEVDFPPDFVTPQLAGKHGIYETEITEIKERVLPELNDEFAKTFNAETMDDLRKGVRQDLQNELNTRQRRNVRAQILKSLSGKVSFDLPESLVEQETRNVVYEIVNENQKRGVPKEAIDKNKEEIYGAAAGTAKERVKIGFLVRKIADIEGIRATEPEVNSRIVTLAQSYNMAPKAFVKELEKRDGVSEIYQQLIHEKVVDLLMENAKLIDVESAPEQPVEAAAAAAAAPEPEQAPAEESEKKE